MLRVSVVWLPACFGFMYCLLLAGDCWHCGGFVWCGV